MPFISPSGSSKAGSAPLTIYLTSMKAHARLGLSETQNIREELMLRLVAKPLAE